MPHINTGPNGHDSTASAFIIRLDGAEPRLMLHHHKKMHQMYQFGGHVEVAENPWKTVLREIGEEAGYELSQLEVLQPDLRLTYLTGALVHPQPFIVNTHQIPGLDHYHSDLDYVFTTREEPTGSRAEGESSDIRLYTAAEIRQLPATEIPENIREASIFVLEKILPVWKPIRISEFGIDEPSGTLA